MDDKVRINSVLNAVGGVLLDKGDGYSVGQLIADLEGDGSSGEADPYHVQDEHFLLDVEQMKDEWRDEPRDPEEVEKVIETLRDYWTLRPELRFCQLVCNAHQVQNGLADFDPEGEYSPYEETLDELSDEQLINYLERGLKNMEGGR